MTKELVISSSGTDIDIALVEDGNLVELNQERAGGGFSVGDLYVGRVRKIMAGLNAAFVEVGYEKDAFLHYFDLGPQFQTLHRISKSVGANNKRVIDISKEKLSAPLPRENKIGNFLKTGDNIIVQIAKEPISSKGPRLTTDLSLAGRHLVLIPFSNKIHISQKIRSSEERKRLKSIVSALLPKNFGAIVRTAAQNKEQEDLEADIKNLLSKWRSAMVKLQTAQCPSLILGEASRATTILRDLLNDSFSNIHIDNSEIYQTIKDYISAIEPNAEKIVKLYKGTIPIFDNYGITKQIKQQFGRTVPFKRGAYLIVEHTEALHVIDVNSGKRAKADENQEQNALECNLNAVPDIARQLRLKDMGGIIVIDFIDLHLAINRQKVYEAMKIAMGGDRAKHNVLPLTKFGLMQITRQRVRPETKIKITESCPTCRGTGQVSPTLLLDEQIESRIAFLVREKGERKLTIHAHPYVVSHITKGLISLKTKWAWRYKAKIKVIPNDSLGMIEYKIFDNQGDTI